MSNAYDKAVELHGDPTNWGLTNTESNRSENDFRGSTNFYKAMKDGLNIAQDCGKSSGCFAPFYPQKSGYDNNYGIEDSAPHIYKVTIQEGMSISWLTYRANCDYTNFGEFLPSAGYCGRIAVDIDGPDKGANTVGKDYFAFMVTKNGVYPEGSPEVYRNNQDNSCKSDWKRCASWVFEKCNRAYLN